MQVDLILAAVATALIFALMVHQAVVYHYDRRRWMAEKQDLLDRLMSRTFSEFAAGRAIETRRVDLADKVQARREAAKNPREDGADDLVDDGLGIPVT